MSDFLSFLVCTRSLPSLESRDWALLGAGRNARLALEGAGQLTIPFTATVEAEAPRRPPRTEAWREGWALEVAASYAQEEPEEDRDPLRHRRAGPDRDTPGAGPGGSGR